MSEVLLDRLRERPQAFDFYQAVRLLQRAAGEKAALLAEGADPAAEAVRFRAAGGFAFPASDLVAVRALRAGGAAQWEMTVSFLELGGAQGPLPVPLAQRVMDRLADGDTASRDFLDLFHHRLVSLLYRIGRLTQPVLEERLPQDTEPAGWLRALVGIGTPGMQDRLPGTDDRALLARAGLLAREVRSQAGLEGLLADHFGVPVSIQPLVGRWLPIPEDQRTRIGRTGASRTLGTDAALGTRWHDPQAAIGIRMGPMDLALYRAFLPADPVTGNPADGTALMELRELVHFYAGIEMDFVLTLVLRADEVPPAVLRAARAPESPRLGWSAWLHTRPAAVDPEVRVNQHGYMPSDARTSFYSSAEPTRAHCGLHNLDNYYTEEPHAHDNLLQVQKRRFGAQRLHQHPVRLPILQDA
ncbi:MAG TPA: type VI secretion system baseplate subunit TssG [Longimicrobium sp.]|uniref:type VI secretion system baseplate subunit TssG n=1 Tax=Longimicrobium sp. TaxID=2029185 RepID=UPI002ED98A57